ncbi:hypothetical protein [Desulfosediminicola flagellatus]|uniref:hypothetical protein n=1 Tax=Desulfosediminicola flagellatus TaxID=2569541 RepID=UPI0012946EB4|nr:hypothetical protein [Desulfosediminicola flagellatus]
MKQKTENYVAPLLAENEDLALSGEVSKESIDFLSHQIVKIEKICEKRMMINPQYLGLLTIPGVGKNSSLNHNAGNRSN